MAATGIHVRAVTRNIGSSRRARATRQLRGYEITELIGEGAFGSIYRASQESIGREVAVKVVRPELADDPRFIRRFEAEAQLVARMEHPHVVPLFDYWREPGGAFLVMRYLRGGSAEQRLVAQGPFHLGTVGQLVEEVGGALAVAHTNGIVHRDVKPANILFDENDISYLADFGIAITDGAQSELDLRSAGSPLYVSPEQVRDGVAGPHSDMYAFGVVLYELLTGEPPFQQVSSVDELLHRKLHERVPLIGDRRPDLPRNVDLVVQQATALQVEDRFVDMGEFVLAFRAAAGGPASGVETTGAPDIDERPRAIASQTLVSIELQGANPYKGLAAFQEGDAADLFGRDGLVEELHSHLESSRFLAVVGPSGSGKSSAVRAGLVPRLRADDRFVAQMIPGPRPMDELETALLRNAAEPLPTLLDQLTADTHGLSRAVERVLPEREGDLVLVIDQFEELFTLASQQERDRFLNALAAAVASERGRLSVVITVRADFYDRPLAHRAVSDLVQANTVAVTPLTTDELERAIAGPAERVGVTIEPALVAELVNEATTSPGGLPLLQFALTQAFEQRSGSRMTMESYREIGGITGAIARRANELYEASSAGEQADIRRLFTRLITPGEGTEDTRRRVPLAELTGIGAPLVDRFGDARLLSFDHDAGTREPTVEVAHEALIREWPLLRSWLDEDRDGLRILRHLGVSARAWQTGGRDDGELYRGGRLEAAEEWSAAHADDLNDAETEFLSASADQRETEIEADLRSQRRLRRLLTGVGIVAIVALIASTVAATQWGRANDKAAEAEASAAAAEAARAEAEDQAGIADQRRTEADEATAQAQAAGQVAADTATRAETSRLAATAQNLVNDDRRLALLLAVEAHERDPGSHETLGALRDALAGATPLIRHLRSGVAYRDLEWVEAGLLMAVTVDGVELIDVETGETTIGLTLPQPEAYAAQGSTRGGRFSAADGPTAIVATEDRRAQVLSIRDLEPRFSLEVASDISSVTVLPGGERVAVATRDQAVHVFDAQSGDEVWSVDLGDDTNLLDQGRPAFGDQYPFARIWGGFAVTTYLNPVGDTLFVATGSYLHRFTFEGEELGERTATGWGGPETAWPWPAAWIFDGAAAGEYIVGHVTSIGTVDASPGWPSRSVVSSTQGTDGAGSPFLTTVVPLGSEILALMSDGGLVTFDRRSGERLARLDLELTAGESSAMAPDGRSVYFAHADGISQVSLGGGGPLTTPLAREAIQSDVTISADGRLVGLGPPGTLGPVSVWADGSSGWALHDELGGPFDFYIDVSPEMTSDVLTRGFVPGGDGAQQWHTYSWTDGHFDEVIDPVPDPTALPLGFHASERWLVLMERRLDQQTWVAIHRWTGALSDLDQPALAEWQIETGGANLVRVDPDEQRLLIGNENGDAHLFETTNWTEIQNPHLGAPRISVARWNSSGSLLASASPDGIITIRRGDTLEPLYELLGSVGTSNNWDNTGGMIFSADDRYLLTNFDGTVRLWNLESRQQVGGRFETYEGTNTGIAYDGEHFQLATAAEDTALVWNMDFDAWPDIACQAAGSNLTRAEWEQWGPGTRSTGRSATSTRSSPSPRTDVVSRSPGSAPSTVPDATQRWAHFRGIGSLPSCPGYPPRSDRHRPPRQHRTAPSDPRSLSRARPPRCPTRGSVRQPPPALETPDRSSPGGASRPDQRARRPSQPDDRTPERCGAWRTTVAPRPQHRRWRDQPDGTHRFQRRCSCTSRPPLGHLRGCAVSPQSSVANAAQSG